MVFASSLTCWADPSLYPNLGPPEPPLLSSICISVDADASDNGGSGKSSDDPIMQSGDEVGGVLLVDASGIAMITDLIVVGGGQCPPFRLSYQGLGEPLCFAAFGPFATTAFYFSR
ncbi:hypothetical protein GW17_00015029 [Ensete ventricosum]|nr:hypothetical protein GW17_00015029 [Ensete ventricosum]